MYIAVPIPFPALERRVTRRVPSQNRLFSHRSQALRLLAEAVLVATKREVDVVQRATRVDGVDASLRKAVLLLELLTRAVTASL